jgi:hypothetical protein
MVASSVATGRSRVTSADNADEPTRRDDRDALETVFQQGTGDVRHVRALREGDDVGSHDLGHGVGQWFRLAAGGRA